jgi:hypothetical protein
VIYRPYDDYIRGCLETLKDIINQSKTKTLKYDGHILAFLNDALQMNQLETEINNYL